MKTKILSLVVLYVMFNSRQLTGQANLYHPMLSDTTVEWIVQGNSHYEIFKICGNKIIKNKSYRIICRMLCNSPNGSNCYVYAQDTIAYMREDSVNRKIYGYSWSFYNGIVLDTTGNEMLLYDHDSIHVGRKLKSLYHTDYVVNNGNPDSVMCVDSTQLLDGSWRKYYTSDANLYSPPPPGNQCGIPANYNLLGTIGIVIEGIGNLSSPFDYWKCPFSPPCNYYSPILLCHKKSNLPLWQNIISSNSCNLILINNPFYKKPFFRLYPSVCTEPYFFIESIYSNITAEIYDLKGSSFGTYSITQNKQIIDISHLKNGMYFVKVSNNEYSMWEKIIVNYR